MTGMTFLPGRTDEMARLRASLMRHGFVAADEATGLSFDQMNEAHELNIRLVTEFGGQRNSQLRRLVIRDFLGLMSDNELLAHLADVCVTQIKAVLPLPIRTRQQLLQLLIDHSVPEPSTSRRQTEAFRYDFDHLPTLTPQQLADAVRELLENPMSRVPRPR